MTTFKQKLVNVLAAYTAGITSMLMIISSKPNIYYIIVTGLIIFYLVNQLSKKNDNI